VDDVASGAVQFLAGISAVTGLLGAFPGTDPVVANQGRPYIFLENPLVVLQGSSLASLVCSDAGSWSNAIPYGTQRFTRLSVEFYVDPQRDANLNVTETPGATKLRGEALFATVNSFLHRRDADVQVWGDMVTASCVLLAEGEFAQVPQPDGDWLAYKQAYYGVGMTGWVDVAI
jgi:hypothetical protein